MLVGKTKIIFFIVIGLISSPVAGAQKTPAKQLTGYLLGVGAQLRFPRSKIFCEIVPAEEAGWEAYYWPLEDVCEWFKEHQRETIDYPLGTASLIYILLHTLR